MSRLFSPLELGPITLPNRIAVAPMCQYSAEQGCATEWHLQHLMSLAMSGAALVMLEATGVESPGRISSGCLGLYSDENERALSGVIQAARAVALPGTAFGIQLSHAGRKASTHAPWDGGGPLGANDNAWPVVAPSSCAFSEGWPEPDALDEAGIEHIRAAFVEAACRAVWVGIEVIEIHMAHGYLLHQFLSPLANHREDRWGGDLAGRMAFPLSVAEAIRAAVPASVVVGARITGTDWLDEGVNEDEAVALARELKKRGLAYVCVTSGGIVARAPIVPGPGFQVPFAARVRREAGIVTRAVGLIADPAQAEAIIARGEADQIALGRAFLDDPRWGWHAAEALGAEIALPRQYARAAPNLWPGRTLLTGARQN